MQGFVTRFTERQQVIQSIFGVVDNFLLLEFRLRGDMMGLQTVLGSTYRTFRQHEPSVIAGHLDFFLSITNHHRDTIPVGKRLLKKLGRQSYRFGDFNSIEIVPAPFVKGTVIPHPYILDQNLFGVRIHTKVAYAEGLVLGNLGDLGYRVQMGRQEETKVFFQNDEEKNLIS